MKTSRFLYMQCCCKHSCRICDGLSQALEMIFNEFFIDHCAGHISIGYGIGY